jgi:hypothetical protein
MTVFTKDYLCVQFFHIVHLLILIGKSTDINKKFLVDSVYFLVH